MVLQAYYNPAGNEIVFPAGIMQSPVFYDPKVPQYLSYGAFGSVRCVTCCSEIACTTNSDLVAMSCLTVIVPDHFLVR